ncbi:MAG TPA: DNA/RNA non-specific endonuclease [Rhodocyclaceae bacterium]|jgi:hypothetical protein|nr:DNA/RNA non-specific endonuclease [Rhodocyclaceae bacterium]
MCTPVFTKSSISLTWANKVTASVVTSASVVLRSDNMSGGSAPDSSINPPGWYDGTCPAHHNRGHLVGNALGGSGTDADNLVTLTSGTNHPFMYEFEEAVKKFVLAHPGVDFQYEVVCNYDKASYTALSGYDIPGASGNPFCLFPAPAFLDLSLKKNQTLQSLAAIAAYLPKPPVDLGTMAAMTSLRIVNGGYKLYGGTSHFAANCASVNDLSNNDDLKNKAKIYARALGHLA